MDDSTDDKDDGIPQLPSDTLKALEEFYRDKCLVETKETQLTETKFEEDWQLSQFWYDERTVEALAKEALASIPSCGGRIACVSCPTVYSRLQKINQENVDLKILEYDKRFESYGNDFIFYDYNEPLNLDPELEGSFNIVLADPPFLSEECLNKVAQTIKFLTKAKILLCTGLVMREHAKDLLNLELCDFKPSHSRNLGNEFSCFINYEWNTEINKL